MSVKDEEKVYRELLQNASQNQRSTATVQSQNALQKAEQTIPTEHVGEADARVDEAINKYLNGRGFKYNTAEDVDYQNYVKEVRQNAHQGRDVSKRTATTLSNGYAPTYADTVASEVYNSQLENLTDAIPTFKNLAQQQHYNEQSRQAEIANLYAQQAQQEYSRNRDTVNDNKAFLNYLYNRYLTDAQGDVQRNADKASIYATQLNSAQSNLAETQSYDNQRYLYNTQSADNKATLTQKEYENKQKIAYQKAEDEYNKRMAEIKAQQIAEQKAQQIAQEEIKAEQKAQKKEESKVFKKRVNEFIEAYNLKEANYNFAKNQIALGYYKGQISLAEVDYIANQLGVKSTDIENMLDVIEKNGGTLERRYGGG